MLEESPEFLRQYCVKLKGILGDDSGKSKICGYALDVDALNQNYSFMDFFIRKCFEEHICSSELPLEAIYQHMEEKFFPLKYPIGSYIRRNLTCAAGNIFSSRRAALSGYDAQYMKLAGAFAQSSEGQKKETAYFLIKKQPVERRPAPGTGAGEDPPGHKNPPQNQAAL